MKYGSLFSGIGGFDLGFERAGTWYNPSCHSHARSAFLFLGKEPLICLRPVTVTSTGNYRLTAFCVGVGMPTKNKEVRRLQNLRYRAAHPETKNVRKRNEPTEVKRRWNIKTRYGLTTAEVDAMLLVQNNKCSICEKTLDKYRIDHDHNNGKVRGLLCHRCNLLIAGIENESFLNKALRYLGVK